MRYRSKRYRQHGDKITSVAPIPLADAIKQLKTFGSTKFNQTVEVSTNLGIDPPQSDQMSDSCGARCDLPKDPPPRTKRRTREHVIAALSSNHVERFFLERGHTFLRTTEDYGKDLVVFTYDQSGDVEPGQIYLQLKATDRPDIFGKRQDSPFSIDVRDYNQWIDEPSPLFVILFHTPTSAAYWIYFQAYFEAKPEARPKAGAKSVQVRFPASNLFDGSAVDYMRGRKQRLLQSLGKRVKHVL